MLGIYNEGLITTADDLFKAQGAKYGFQRPVPQQVKKDRQKYEPLSRNKILVMNDLHVPFQREDCLDIIASHKDEICAIVFGGDFLDCESISSFPTIGRMNLEDEVAAGISFLQSARGIVGPEVKMIIIRGNHENRMKMYLAKMQEKNMYKFLNPNILTMLRDGFKMYTKDGDEKVLTGVSDVTIVNNWYVNINDEIIVCHPNNYSAADVKNAKLAIEHFITKGAKFTTVIVAHNHHQGEVNNYLGKYGVESGCLCKSMGYIEARTNAKPQDCGYVLVGFNAAGHVDKNNTKVYKLEPEDIDDSNPTIYIPIVN